MTSPSDPAGPAAPSRNGSSPRRFCRLVAGEAAPGYAPVPSDGLCLNAFVLLAPPGAEQEVLLGHVDPRADWQELGAMDPARAEVASHGWMLPASHLLYYEGPEAAGRRILAEQVGLTDVAIEKVSVRSETYPSRYRPEQRQHWDLHFLLEATAPRGWTPRHPAWRELEFLDPGGIADGEFARAHDEVLELAGRR